MSRHFSDWLSAYMDYASFSEAPPHMHFWTGVATVAGALRRRVWIDQGYFKWHANHYIILVAPPGVVSKSTTAAIGMNLLRQVSGINFGPDVVTWPALVSAFASVNECFELNGEWHTQCALTLESSEFGNLVNPQDRDMIDLLVTLWDSKQGGFDKRTKTSGNDKIENPWINMIACTTPAWIAGNFPEYIIGGGFTSRCLFVYADQKAKLVAYPSKHIPTSTLTIRQKLIDDLSYIAMNLCGPYSLTKEAIEWGETWYAHHYAHPPKKLAADDRFGGYLARKQTHIHKLGMIIAASCRDQLVIEANDLALANKMVSDLEEDMQKVFAKIGRTDESVQAENLIRYITTHGPMPFETAYRFIHLKFPDLKDFEGILLGALKAGLIKQEFSPSGAIVFSGTVRKDH